MPISDYLMEIRSHVGASLLLMPAATGIIHDDLGRVLVVYTTNEMWGTPGGALDPGETPATAVVREMREELGIEVVPEALLAVVRQHLVYPHGDEVEYTSVAFRCRVVAGEITAADDEVLRWEWVEPAEVVRRGVPIPEHVLYADYSGPPAF